MDVLLLAIATLAVMRQPDCCSFFVALCGAGAVKDQQHGADLMWVGGSMVMFIASMALAIEFARHESRVAKQEGSPFPMFLIQPLAPQAEIKPSVITRA